MATAYDENLEIGSWRTLHSAWPALVWSGHVTLFLAQQPGHGWSQRIHSLRYRHRLHWGVELSGTHNGGLLIADKIDYISVKSVLHLLPSMVHVVVWNFRQSQYRLAE